MSLNTLLMSDEMMKERTIIHGNTDPKLIYPDIKVAQDMYILPILGTALYAKLQTAVNTGIWTNLADYKALLDNYILDALQYYTMAELPTSMSYQFWNKGIVRKQGQDTDLPSMSELVDISNKYRDRGQWYANRLKLYLIQNANKMFPEYLAPGNGIDTITPETKSFSSSIYLGDDRGNPYCNPGGFTGQPYKD
jgi:hypothetical protein